jgi:hypothetical protein
MNHGILVLPSKENLDTFDKLLITGGRDLEQDFEDVHALDFFEGLTHCRWCVDLDVLDSAGSQCGNGNPNAIQTTRQHEISESTGKQRAVEYAMYTENLDLSSQRCRNASIVPCATNKCKSDGPLPRKDSAWVHDSDGSIILFGGWAGYWLADTWQLHGPTTGPPHGCNGLQTAAVPIPGTHVVLEGNVQQVTNHAARPGDKL